MPEDRVIRQYRQFIASTQRSIAECLSSMPEFDNLSKDGLMPETWQVKALIDQANGDAICLHLNDDLISAKRDSNVRDLRTACQNCISRRIRAQHSQVQVNWPHIWRRYALAHRGRRLRKLEQKLSDLGICDGDQLEFLHVVRRK